MFDLLFTIIYMAILTYYSASPTKTHTSKYDILYYINYRYIYVCMCVNIEYTKYLFAHEQSNGKRFDKHSDRVRAARCAFSHIKLEKRALFSGQMRKFHI